MKGVRVPLIVGLPNCGRSTVLDNVKNVFGKEHVLNKPKLGAPNGALAPLVKGDNILCVAYSPQPINNLITNSLHKR